MDKRETSISYAYLIGFLFVGITLIYMMGVYKVYRFSNTSSAIVCGEKEDCSIYEQLSRSIRAGFSK